MYRIAILTEQETQGQCFEAQISRFCKKRGVFPQIVQYQNQEDFFEAVSKAPLSHALLALPGVGGLNAVEHLRALHPSCRIIWCSDLDFSLHAFRLRVDYFLLMPVTEDALQQGFCTWLEGKVPFARFRSDYKKHNKEDDN